MLQLYQLAITAKKYLPKSKKEKFVLYLNHSQVLEQQFAGVFFFFSRLNLSELT